MPPRKLRSWQALRHHWIPATAWLAGGLIWAVLALLIPGAIQPVQERVSDWVWRAGSTQAPERRLILLDIDERSLHELGPWPWERTRIAQLMGQLAAQGVALQIWDVVFAEARAGDDAMRAQIAQRSPVLSQVFALPGQGDDVQAGQLAGAWDWSGCPAPFANASGYLGNEGTLLPQGIHVGHITPRLSGDGVVRGQPAVLCYQDRAYGALALIALTQASGESHITLAPGNGWLQPRWQLRSSNNSFAPVPLQDNGDLLLPWRLQPESFISISAADLLGGRVPAALLRNAWVLVGSSAFGINDRIATPLSSAAVGMQAHAQLLTAAMDGRLPYTPQGHLLLQGAGLLAGLGLMTVLQRCRRTLPQHPGQRAVGPLIPAQWLPLVALGGLLLLLLAHAWLLLRHDLWVGWLAPAVALAGAALLWAALEHARSRRDRDRLYTHLSSYLPRPVAAALALQPPSSAIKASVQQVSVMFADIRNFSAYCEERPPQEAAAVLHAFFSTASDIVAAEGGVLEAFQGDAILAVWYGDNATESTGEHARSALRAAVRLSAAMQGALPDPAPAGLEPLALGIGLESGPAMAGSFGQASRRTHMVLGRTVTIANRLVHMTADLAHPILVGEGLAAQIETSELVSLGMFFLDGLRVPHHIYAHPLSADTTADQGHD